MTAHGASAPDAEELTAVTQESKTALYGLRETDVAFVPVALAVSAVLALFYSRLDLRSEGLRLHVAELIILYVCNR